MKICADSEKQLFQWTYRVCFEKQHEYVKILGMAILPGYPFWKRVPGYESEPGYPGTTRFAQQSNFVLRIVNTGGYFSSWSQQSQVVSNPKLLFFHCLELKFQKNNISCHTFRNINSRIMSNVTLLDVDDRIKVCNPFVVIVRQWEPLLPPIKASSDRNTRNWIYNECIGKSSLSKCDFWARSWNTPYSLGNIW